jgi:hypothetical protein
MTRWICSDVVQTIWRTGTYTLPGYHAQAAREEREEIEIPRPREERPKQNEREILTLTGDGHLPPPRPRRRHPHASVSWHLLKVWVLLRDSDDWLSNHEIAAFIGMNPRTARAHTHYLADLGLIDLHEMSPRYLYGLAPDAKTRSPREYERLNHLATILQNRLKF